MPITDHRIAVLRESVTTRILSAQEHGELVALLDELQKLRRLTRLTGLALTAACAALEAAEQLDPDPWKARDAAISAVTEARLQVKSVLPRINRTISEIT